MSLASDRQGSTVQDKASRVSGFLLLFGITLFWGCNWPAMKIVLGELPVWIFRTISLFGGGLGLLLITRLAGLSIAVPRRDIGPLLLCALFNVVGWQLFTGYGISLMPAGRASIIAFTMPVWAALLAVPVLGERITANTLGGLLLGMTGLAVLLGPDIAVLGTAPLGAVFMLGAALSWAAGTVAVKRFSWQISSAALTAWMLLAGSLPVATGALILDQSWPEQGLSIAAWTALAYVLLLPTLFCQCAYVVVVRRFPAIVAAISTLLVPVLGMLSSALVLGEAITPRDILALLLVCAALALVLVPTALGRRAPPPAIKA